MNLRRREFAGLLDLEKGEGVGEEKEEIELGLYDGLDELAGGEKGGGASLVVFYAGVYIEV